MSVHFDQIQENMWYDDVCVIPGTCAGIHIAHPAVLVERLICTTAPLKMVFKGETYFLRYIHQQLIAVLQLPEYLERDLESYVLKLGVQNYSTPQNTFIRNPLRNLLRNKYNCSPFLRLTVTTVMQTLFSRIFVTFFEIVIGSK